MSKIEDSACDKIKAKPMLFSTAMVIALLDGRKTQTRRIVKLPLIDKWGTGCEIAGCEINSLLKQGLEICPHPVGSVIWVKETFAAPWGEDYHFPEGGKGIFYRADNPEKLDSDGNWTPSIFMPRSASRIDLEVTAVRVERVQEISHRDALAEGVEYDVSKRDGSPVKRFQKLWESINGKGSCANNPWVWVYTFTLIKKPTETGKV